MLERLERFQSNYAKLVRLKFFVFQMTDELLKQPKPTASPHETIMACVVTARRVQEAEAWADSQCNLRTRGVLEMLGVSDKSGTISEIGKDILLALDALSGTACVVSSTMDLGRKLLLVFQTKQADKEVVALVGRVLEVMQKFSAEQSSSISLLFILSGLLL